MHACIVIIELHIGLCLYKKVLHRGSAGVSVPCAQGGVAVAQPTAHQSILADWSAKPLIVELMFVQVLACARGRLVCRNIRR